MKLRLSEPQRLIDIGRIPELRGIREAGGTVTIGAATTHHEIATSSALQQRCPILAEAASMIGDQQVRNRGTIGGSLAHADPSADYPAVMLALDASFSARWSEGTARGEGGRTSSWISSRSTWRADEILASVQFAPIRQRGLREARAARLALRDRRRRGGAPGERWDDHVGARRPDRRVVTRAAPDERRAGTRRAQGVEGHDRSGREAGGRRTWTT